MSEIAEYVEVEAPVEQVYAYWRDFNNFRSFVPEQVEDAPEKFEEIVTRW